ncbi:SRPBCC family protein [Pseudonocardia sp. TRM90224]|uniref:SRPBCC family protein n=1 Tax=Pseudonocardia sp. TRM90224 TaxID=2812678 RepID=UPI001E30E632|nr:SRPBCC family protein [Pseudonocardia sp. TRM90224]
MKIADGPTAEGVVHVAAAPERVWSVVSDIHVVASISREIQEVSWLDGAEEAACGHRFRGRNSHPEAGEWTTTSTVVECDPPRVLAWAVEDPASPSAVWRFELTSVDGGTELRQHVRLGTGPSMFTPIIEEMPEMEEEIVDGRMDEFRESIAITLAALKDLAETDASPRGK